ncbi:alpha-tectorin-like [Festucalex cinctus]
MAGDTEQASKATSAPQAHPFLTSLHPTACVMKANSLLLLLAAVCSQFGQTHAQTQSVSLTSCPIYIFGKMQTDLEISQIDDLTHFCFMATNSTVSECIEISGANEFTVAVDTGDAASGLEAVVKAELPQLAGTLTCYLKFNLFTGSQLNMTIRFLKFESQTALSVLLASYQNPDLRVHSVGSIAGFDTNFTNAEGVATKYLDLSGCRIQGLVVFPASNTIISDNCTNYSCSAQAQIIADQTCGAMETCNANNMCQPTHRVCTVTGSHVIQFFGQVSSITDRCMYRLLEPTTGGNFILRAAFEDRRSLIMTFLDRLDLELPSSNVSFSLETSGRVRVNGVIQTLGTSPTDVHGVLLSRDENGVTLEISNNAISDVDVSIYFDGATARITVPDGAPLQGLCGDASDQAYSPVPVADSQSFTGCEIMPRVGNTIVGVNSAAGIELCSLLRLDPFTACHNKVEVEPYIQSCNDTLNDYPIKDNLNCQFFEVYAGVCKQQYGIDLGDWRSSVNCPSDNLGYCQNHTCSANEFCGDSAFNQPTCLCRAIFASEYKLTNTFGDPPTCHSGRGSISLYGCLLEEEGIDYSALHLKNDTCVGERDEETHLVTFNFDSSNTCGTETQVNNSFVVLRNSIAMGSAPENNSIITRTRMVELNFTCVYRQPEINTLTFLVKSSAVVRRVVSETENYTLTMQAYTDSERTQLLAPNAYLALNQQIWIQLSGDGLDGNTVKIVTQSCWVTQEPSPNATLRYDLIIDGCPNLQDGTVEIADNGNGMDNYFSFRMFQFVDSASFYLHCNVNLCVKQQCAPDCSGSAGRRRRALKEASEEFGGDLLSMEWII